MRKINRHNKGFTLIELMTGILLTSMFVSGIAQVFLGTSKNFKTQRSLSYMMEDARFVLDKINSEFRRIGFLTNREISDWDRATIFNNQIALDYAANTYTIRNNGVAVPGTVLTMEAGEAIRGTTNLGGLGSDSVIIRYQLGSGTEFANNQYSPCTNGFELVAGELETHRHIIVIVFYMEADAGVGSNVLYCKAFRENLDVPGLLEDDKTLLAVPLISNVERLRILYGQTNAASTVYRTNAQVTASAPPNWERVKSVRISLALRSEDSNISIATPGNYTINGKLFVAPTNAAEKHLYRVFSTTVAFRNELL